MFVLTTESAFRIRIRIHQDPLHLAGSGSTSIPAPDPDPLRFLSSDPNPLKKALIWILRKGKSEDLDPDPLFPNVDPRIRIRIHVKMIWIRNAEW